MIEHIKPHEKFTVDGKNFLSIPVEIVMVDKLYIADYEITPFEVTQWLSVVGENKSRHRVARWSIKIKK